MSSRRTPLLALALAALPLLGGAEGGGCPIRLVVEDDQTEPLPCSAEECGTRPVCELDGVVIRVGESIRAADGCNTCDCQDDGTLFCSEMGCLPGCWVEELGVELAIGESFTRENASCGEDCTCTEGGLACYARPCRPPACLFDGEEYAVGAAFRAPDGCNTCTCLEDGRVVCTERACPGRTCVIEGEGVELAIGQSYTMPGYCGDICTCTEGGLECYARPCPPPTCEVDGRGFGPGETFPAADGCNTCVCMDDGSVACTERACPTNPCGPASCDVTPPACPEGQVPEVLDGCFTNRCIDVERCHD